MSSHYLEWLENLERLDAQIPRRVVVDRKNPFEALTEEEFINKYRLDKECTNNLIQVIKDDLLTGVNNRGCPVPPHIQVLVVLCYLGIGKQKESASCLLDVSQSFVSRCVPKVCRVIAGAFRDRVKMPSGKAVVRVMEDFQKSGGIPNVLGCIGCMHVGILQPPGDINNLYKNKQGYFSLNVQAVCGPQLEFYNIITRWYGSADSNHVFQKSLLSQELTAGLYQGHLLGGCEYTCRKYLHTPILNPRTTQEKRYNEAHAQTYSMIKRAFSILKRRFPILKKRVHTELCTTKVMIVAAVILHNMAIEQNIPMPDEISSDEIDSTLDREALSKQSNSSDIKERDYIVQNYF